jgi:hypothetical protein
MSKVLKICPRCGRTFQCDKDLSCWCNRLVIPEKLKEFLRENFTDCLCENCLIDLGAEKNF